MKLQELLAAVRAQAPVAKETLELEVTGLSTNSHACKPGDLFLGMPGERVDGGTFWPSALESGAVAALVTPEALALTQAELEKHDGAEPRIIPVADMTEACARVAAAFYGNPAQQLELVGVTGTNGKTTTTHLIEFLLSKRAVALFGTLYARWPGFEETATFTTPFATDLHDKLAKAVKAGADIGIMEVSSHSLAQKRVLGCPFEVAAFTNLTQDHLDFHKDMEDYFAAKALLFGSDYLKGRAVINIDDRYGRRLRDLLPYDRFWSYSTKDESADLRTYDMSYGPAGAKGMLHSPVGDAPFSLPLVGQYNVENMLAAVGAALHLGVDLQDIVRALPEFPGVPGRMERVEISPDQDISAIVDYSHTPDSLENMLKAMRPFVEGQLWCVFGCGGDRDRTKRPLMGEIAARLADRVIVTSDNPRTENPTRIIEDILKGIPREASPLIIPDRAQAIRTAILQAEPGDGVAIAGKGHEDYQILGTEKIHFDDREQAREALKERGR